MKIKQKAHSAILVGLFIIIVLVFTACGGTEETADAQTYTVGILNAITQLEPAIDGFKTNMNDLGYVEDENITYIFEGTVGMDGLPAAAQALVDANVDLILATGTFEAQTVQSLTDDIPIIFVVSSDPVGAGLVNALSEPGGNITGVVMPPTDQRRLELLLELDPTISNVYVPYNPNDVGPARTVVDIEEVAPSLNIMLTMNEVHDVSEAAQAIAEIPEDTDAVFIGPDDLFFAVLPDLIGATMERQLPLSLPTSDLPPGTLTGYGPSINANGRQAARLADQVLSNGAEIASLPVENADSFLAISLPVAEAIGLEIPDTILEQADTIIRDNEG